MTKHTLLESLSQDYVSLEIDNEFLFNTTMFTLPVSLRQDSNAKTELHVLYNTTKPTLPESLGQESEFIEKTLSYMTKPTLHCLNH